jgi:hypothetical protein
MCCAVGKCWVRYDVYSVGEEALRIVLDSWNLAYRPCRTAFSNKLHGPISRRDFLGSPILHCASWP